jgi:glutamate-1-semialdehyde aminotransferase
MSHLVCTARAGMPDPYPFYFSRAKGTSMWDVDGNEYTDYNMGFGVLIEGHAHPLVVDAIKEQAEKGTDFDPNLPVHLCSCL